MVWSKSCSNPFGPSKSAAGPVIPRPASIVVYTARMPVMAGEMPFQFDTGSACTAASDTLSTVDAAMAAAVRALSKPSNFADPADADIASCRAWLRPRAMTGTWALNRHWIS